LADTERELLERLDLFTEARQGPVWPLALRVMSWAGTRLSRALGRVALAVLWFLFIAQIYVAEFLQNHGAWGWLNQPLVQLPWFHYVPARLKNPTGEVVFVLLLTLVVLLIRSLAGKAQRLKPRMNPAQRSRNQTKVTTDGHR